MPIHEYRTKDGGLVERLFLPGEAIPDEIEINGLLARRAVSATAVRFKGSFSGGTSSRHMYHPESATPRELREHARRQRGYQDEKDNKAIHDHVVEAVAGYAV